MIGYINAENLNKDNFPHYQNIAAKIGSILDEHNLNHGEIGFIVYLLLMPMLVTSDKKVLVLNYLNSITTDSIGPANLHMLCTLSVEKDK